MGTQEETEVGIRPQVFSVILVIMLVVGSVILLNIALANELNVDLQRKERAAAEISENLLVSPLTTGKALFTSDELKKFDGSNEEPYVKHCRFAYRAVFESEGNKLEFGFDTGPVDRFIGFLDSYSMNVLAVVDDKPGTMQITVYEDALTHVTCAIQRAYVLKQKEMIPCIAPPKNEFQLQENVKSVTCFFVLEKIGDDVCMAHPDYLNARECRHMADIDVQKYEFSETRTDKGKQMFLVAYPLKSDAPTSCGDVTDAIIAGKNDDVKSILLCTELITTGSSSRAG